MELEDIKILCDAAIKNNLMFEQEGVMLNTDNGANHSAIALLGTLLINVGKSTFNSYLDVQVKWLGWLSSKSNCITKLAYELRQKYRQGNQITKEMLEDAEQNLIKPIMLSHVRNNGAPATDKQKEAICVMLIAKIAWDFNLGNEALAKSIRMFDDSLLKEIEKYSK